MYIHTYRYIVSYMFERKQQSSRIVLFGDVYNVLTLHLGNYTPKEECGLCSINYVYLSKIEITLDLIMHILA